MRVACYERVSSKEQAMHGLSLGDQRKALEEWCEKNGHVIVDHYCDAGVSGRMPLKKRPELLRLLEDVKNGKIQLVIFIKLDRFFRNTGQYFLANEVLEAHKVPWKAILEDYETETAAGRLKVTIMLGIAQNEAETTSERLKFTFSQMRERGESTNGTCPFGLKIENKKVVPGAKAYIAKEMFEHFLGSRNVSETRDWMNDTYGEYFTYNGLKGMLKRRSYVEAGVISEELFAKVQELFKKRLPRNPTKNTFLFTGMIFCSECQKRMRGQNSRGNIYYLCNTKWTEHRCNHSSFIREDFLENELLKNILSEVDRYNLTLSENKKRNPKISLEDIQRKKDKLTDLYLNDRISKKKYDEEYNKLDAIIIEPEKKKVDREKVVSMLEVYNELPQNSKKQFWGSLIRKISVDNDNNFAVELLY